MVKPSDPNWSSFVEEPFVASDPSVIEWDEFADVVIVGFGAAGAATAIEARQRGESVKILDRFQGGGATILSGGIVYAGGGTRQQKAAGVEDSPENMFRYLSQETQGCVSDELLREFCDSSVETMEWLEALGLEFPGNLTPVKTSYPMNPHYLYYSGNEGSPAYAEHARPAARGHRHQAKGQAGGKLYGRLKQATLKAGADVILQTKVTRLIVDSLGSVIGVEARRMRLGSWAAKIHAVIMNMLNPLNAPATLLMVRLIKYLERLELRSSEKFLLKSNKGVVLASGGFICNSGMTDEYLPKYSKTMRNGSPGCDGSGIRLGQSAGAATRLMSRASAWRFINPPKAFTQGIMVNRKGERYCNEGAYGAQIGYHMCEHNEGVGWLILDSTQFAQAKLQLLPGRALLFQSAAFYMTMFFNTKKGDSLAALAKNTGFDEETLIQSIETYNRICRNEIPDPMRKTEEFLGEILQPPYYALNFSKDSSTFPLAVVTFGGLSVDEKSQQVLREDGSLIKGLYAAGRCAAGLPSNHYMSGFAIADCIFTGRKAAKAISLEKDEGL